MCKRGHKYSVNSHTQYIHSMIGASFQEPKLDNYLKDPLYHSREFETHKITGFGELADTSVDCHLLNPSN